MIRYFISDLHLGSKRPDLIRAFVLMAQALLNKHQNGNAPQLYILGDFYEAWIGDDYQPDWNKPIEEALKNLANNNIKIFFIHGNRDFLIGNAWYKRVGTTPLNEQTLINQERHSILLTHGDEYCQDDLEYQTFRTIVRTPKWQANILSMPLEKRIVLAEQLRNSVKNTSADKSENIMDVTERSVSESLIRHGSDILIHGHTHRPDFHFEKHYTRCVLGDWDHFIWLATLQDDILTQAQCRVDSFLKNGLCDLKIAHSLSILHS